MLRRVDMLKAFREGRHDPGTILFQNRAGHFRYFLIFSIIKKRCFAFFIKLIWLGVGYLNRIDAEIGY